jgi:hypothetical protein
MSSANSGANRKETHMTWNDVEAARRSHYHKHPPCDETALKWMKEELAHFDEFAPVQAIDPNGMDKIIRWQRGETKRKPPAKLMEAYYAVVSRPRDNVVVTVIPVGR